MKIITFMAFLGGFCLSYAQNSELTGVEQVLEKKEAFRTVYLKLLSHISLEVTALHNHIMVSYPWNYMTIL